MHLLPYHVYAGRAPDDALANWRTKFEVVRPVAIGSFEREEDYDEFVSAFMAMLHDDSVFTYSTLVLVEARRPELVLMDVEMTQKGRRGPDFRCELVADEATKDACLTVLETVRREELRRAGASVVDSDVFAGADAPYELIALRRTTDEQVVGTIRLTPAATVANLDAANTEYRLETIDPVLLARTWILTRLALLPEVRSSSGGLELYCEVYRWGLRNDVGLLLLSCEPNLLGLYEWLGGRIYGRVHQGIRGGFRVAMVFVLHDRRHFAASDSLLTSVYDEIAPAERTSGGEWLQRLIDGGIDAGVRPLIGDTDGYCAALTEGLSDVGRDHLLRKGDRREHPTS